MLENGLRVRPASFRERAYYTGDYHTIAGREDFDKYRWPVMTEIDYFLLEAVGLWAP